MQIDNEFVYELYFNDIMIYKNFNLNYVFHEYLSYLKNKNYTNLVIKKKLNDSTKKFDLYLEDIYYQNNKFLSENNVYDITNVNCLKEFLNNNVVQNNVNTTKIIDQKITKNKVIVKKPDTKIKIVDYNKDKSDLLDITDVKIDKPSDDIEELDESKLQELEELILKMEILKEEEQEKLKKQEEIIQLNEMNEREKKMQERSINEKRKEINNIYEADKRVYYKFKEIIEEIKNQKLNGIDKRPSEMTKSELTANCLIKNDKEFEIPVLFMHKFPIFKFLDENNLLENSFGLLAYKQIYYKNYELHTESRKYFGDKVYLFNEEDIQNYNENLSKETITLIEQFSNMISTKIIDIEKLVSNKFDQSSKDFNKMFQNNSNKKQESDSDNDSDNELNHNK